MLEKILQALKDARVEGSSVSDRTLTEQATIASKFITTDEQLEAYDAKGVVSSIEGNINHYTAEAFKKRDKTAEEKTKKDQEAAEKAKKEKEKTEVSAEMKLVLESLEKTNARLDAMQEGQTKNSRFETLKKEMAEMPDVYKKTVFTSFGKTTFESDEDFQNYLEEVKTHGDEFKQNMAENGLPVKPSKEGAQKQGAEDVNPQVLETLKGMTEKKTEDKAF